MITAKKIFIVFLLFFFFAIPALPEEIHDAARQGDLAKIKRLLEKNPGLLEARNQNEKTPLHFAAQGGHKEIVEFLIGKGADINAKNIAKETQRGSGFVARQGSGVEFRNLKRKHASALFGQSRESRDNPAVNRKRS